jgi:peptidyl-prolyl cis-trans isomerase C
MRGRLPKLLTLLMSAFLVISPARAGIKWDYAKPGSERGAGDWLTDLLGLSGHDYAVIIGLHRFQYFNPLDATANDPERVFKFLRDEVGFDYILMLQDEDVTYQKLRSLFEFELPRILDENDRFLLFWSGHGTQFRDALEVELGYLPLISSPADDKSTMVAMRDLERWDNELPVKHALFLLDACFSGLAGRTALADEQELEINELLKSGHHIISAGGRDQQTIASRQEWQGSIFTHALLKALRGEADRYGGPDGGDGVINLYELVADISETVKSAKAAVGWNRPLRPILHVLRGEGQFFFLTEEGRQAHLEALEGQFSDVAATVDGEAVYLDDVQAVARALPEQYRQVPLPQIYSIVLDRAIDFQLLSREAERLKLSKRPELRVELKRARAGVLRDAFVRQKIEEGTTADKLRARYEQVKDEAGFSQEEVHARHILVGSEDEAKEIIAALADGADFATLAGERSVDPSGGANGGDLGFFRREQMVPEFAEAAFALQPGQRTEKPVQTQFGWHVIEVVERRMGTPSFEETEPRLRQELAREIVTALVADLRDDAEIERFNLDGSPMRIAPEGEQGSAPQTQPEQGEAQGEQKAE